MSREGALRVTAGWAHFHGLAVRLVEKRLRGVQKRTAALASVMELADAVLKSVVMRVE